MTHHDDASTYADLLAHRTCSRKRLLAGRRRTGRRRMTPDDFYDHVVVFVWARWGKPEQGPWTERAAGTVAADFEPFQVGHVREALHNLYYEGYQLAPSPSKLLAATTHIARSSCYT